MPSDPSGNTPQLANSPLAKAFQEAYQKAMLLQRLDEQLLQIAEKRNALVDELKDLRSELNGEFTRLIDGEEQNSIKGKPKVAVSINTDAFRKLDTSDEEEEAAA